MTTQLTPAEWDAQFARQATWTKATRNYLYRRANLVKARWVLDVGSGTGTVTEELAAQTHAKVVGVDIEPDAVAFSRGRRGRAEYRIGDAHALPLPTAHFDVTVCHFVLLWCRDARQVVHEMVRVTRMGGAILICAEPDYGGRIDHPDLPIGRWQAEALRSEGADPFVGRKLRGLFALPTVRQVEVGVIPGVWDLATLRDQFGAEWALWERSFAGVLPLEEIARMKEADRRAIESGERLVHVPVFYALARV